MNKTELIQAVAKRSGHSQAKTGEVLNTFFELVGETLAKGEHVNILGFGTFTVAEFGPRAGRNPATGEAMEIPGGKRPKFTPGAYLKNAVK